MKFFDHQGQPTNSDSYLCFAKLEHGKKLTSYYVKFCSSGIEAGRMLNPFSPLYNPATLQKWDKERGQAYYIYKPVPQAAFDHYIKFLQTGNQAWYRLAERAMI